MTPCAPKGVNGWHFLPADGCLAHYKPKTKVRAGVTYTVSGPLTMCVRGLHFSRRAIDALDYAPGPIVCRIVATGDILHGEDKSVCTERRVIAVADASEVLREFALLCSAHVARSLETAAPRAAARAAALAACYSDTSTARSTIEEFETAWDVAREAHNTELESMLKNFLEVG